MTGIRLNRIALISEALNLLFILLSKAIVEAIFSGVTSALNTLLIIIVVLLFLVGSAFLITYLVQKNGMLDSYEAFSDIMTEKEFKHWQERKKTNINICSFKNRYERNPISVFSCIYN